MKIVHIIWSLTSGGAENMLVDILNIQADKAEVSLIIINKLYDKELLINISNRIKIFLINRIPFKKSLFFYIKLLNVLNNIKPDIIHCHEENIIKLLLLCNKKIKLCLTLHHTNGPMENLLKYDKIFAISKSVSTIINNYFNCKLNTKIIYNGINVNKVARGSFAFKKNEFRIVQIGRLIHKIKGQDKLIMALSSLLKSNDHNAFFKCDFIGEGESFDDLKSLVEQNNLQNNVFFLGKKDRDWIYNNLYKYNLLIQPSLFEGFGLTVVEAMAAKVPILVSNIEGPCEIINNGEFGYTFDINNIDDLANKILLIYKNSNNSIHINMIENAFNHVLNNFDITKTANNYLSEYNDMIF